MRWDHKSEKKPPAEARIVFLDWVRGVCILFVLWYHLCYDLYAFYGSCSWILSGWMDRIRDGMVCLLVLISGICCHFSRNNFKRGLVCFGLAMVTTLVTYLVDPQCYIRFGVLHMFGVSMLLYAVLHRLSGERQYGERAAGIAAVCFAAGFLVCFPIWNGGLGLYQWIVFKLPAAFYASDFLFWLGFPSARFVSADYYPLLPWSLLFLSGACLGQLANRTPDWMKKSRLSGLSFIGKHTMFLYLLHQPAYYLIFWLIAACKGRA